MEEVVYRQLFEMEDSHWWFRGRRAVVRALLHRAGLPAAPGGLRVLDAGCGTGRNLSEYAHLGPVAGVDPSPTAVAFCHERGFTGVVQADLEERLPFEDGAFGLVTATDVLEHIERDDLAAAELRRITGPGGRLLVTVPAYQRLWSHHDETHHHKRRYTRRRLLAVLEGAGWEPVVATYFNSILLPPIALARLAARNRSEGSDYEKGAAALALPMRAEAALIRRGVRLPAGVSVGVVCR